MLHFETQHSVSFCGRKFKKSGIIYTYLEAGFNMGKSVIRFKDDSNKFYELAEEEFFSKISKNDIMIIQQMLF